jgi:hypothetical protein
LHAPPNPRGTRRRTSINVARAVNAPHYLNSSNSALMIANLCPHKAGRGSLVSIQSGSLDFLVLGHFSAVLAEFIELKLEVFFLALDHMIVAVFANITSKRKVILFGCHLNFSFFTR